MRNILRACVLIAAGLLVAPISAVASAEPPPMVSITYATAGNPDFPPLTIQLTAMGEPLTWRGTLTVPVGAASISPGTYELEVPCYDVGYTLSLNARAIEHPDVIVSLQATGGRTQATGAREIELVLDGTGFFGNTSVWIVDATTSVVVEHVTEELYSWPTAVPCLGAP